MEAEEESESALEEETEGVGGPDAEQTESFRFFCFLSVGGRRSGSPTTTGYWYYLFRGALTRGSMTYPRPPSTITVYPRYNGRAIFPQFCPL